MVSIITTVKNGSRYILETLESINNQTFKGFEHIIVDDGSTDNTVAILEEFKTSHPHYDLSVFTPGHLGRGKALNFAVAKAKYPWIAIIDADDIWHPQKLEAQLKIVSDHKDITVLATATELFTSTVDFTENSDFTFKKIVPKRMLYGAVISHSSVIIKKEYAIYDEDRKSQFDAELWLRLAFKNKQRLAIVSQVLNFHRIHENQSFEASKGISYQWNALKLSSAYSISNFMLLPFGINLMKFIYRLLPRKIRFLNLK